MNPWIVDSVPGLIEEKNHFYSGKGDKAKELLDRLEALEFHRMKEIEKHAHFLEAMQRNRDSIRKTEEELKSLFKI